MRQPISKRLKRGGKCSVQTAVDQVINISAAQRCQTSLCRRVVSLPFPPHTCAKRVEQRATSKTVRPVTHYRMPSAIVRQLSFGRRRSSSRKAEPPIPSSGATDCSQSPTPSEASGEPSSPFSGELVHPSRAQLRTAADQPLPRLPVQPLSRSLSRLCSTSGTATQ